MPKFATAADSLTTALAVVDSRLREIDINEQLELYLELINRRAAIQQAIGVTLSGDVTIDNVAITSSALPTGASTSALQSSIQADAGFDASKAISIQGITNGKTIPVSFSGSLPSGTNAIGSITNTAFIANAGTNLNTSALALESGGNLAGINTKLPSGLTVTSTRLLTDGSGVTQPVSAASLPLPTGAATSANQSTANSSLSSIDGKLSAKATSAPTTSVASSATSVTLLNENSNRKFASFRNDSTAIAYIELGATATTSSVYKLAADGFMSLDNYTGVVSCIWASANGNMRISEGV